MDEHARGPAPETIDSQAPRRKGPSFELRSITTKDADRYVAQFHRHNGKARGAMFALAAFSEGRLVGVAIVGRPIARMLQDGRTVELRRLCTDGTKNAASFLYARAWRAAQALGWRRMVTYTLKSESGSSLRAVGFLRIAGEVKAHAWTRPGRPRRHQSVYDEDKLRWVVTA